jgi:hypothetical protein
MDFPFFGPAASERPEQTQLFETSDLQFDQTVVEALVRISNLDEAGNCRGDKVDAADAVGVASDHPASGVVLESFLVSPSSVVVVLGS